MQSKVKANATTFRTAALATAILMLLLSASVASAATITVDDGGGADYTSIQAAVDNATAGDVIEVAAGTYYEHVVVNKSVKLQGESNLTTIIDGSGSGNVIDVTTDEITIDDFKIQNGSTGIYATSSSNVFSNNSITNIVGANGISGGAGGLGSGIYLSGSTNNTLTSNTISNITGGTGDTGGYGGSGGAGGIGSSIYLSDSNNNTLTYNTISNIIGGPGGGPGGIIGSGGIGGIGSGIYLTGSINNTLTSNSISNITGGTGGTGGENSYGGAGGIGSGIYIFSSINNTVISNTISIITGGTGGTASDLSSGGTGGIGSGIYFSSSTNNILTSNNISNIIGGNGGMGMYSDSGGTGGISSGIYLSGSINNTLSSNTINNIIGGSGGMGGSSSGSVGADQVGYGIYLEPDSYQNTILSTNTMGNESIIYYYGVNSIVIENYVLTANINTTNLGKIVLINSSNSIIRNNLISNFTGETGGTGGYYASGGTGRISSGIYLSGSINNTLTFNNISSISGGIGGTGGRYRSGGAGGIGSGIYLFNSPNNTLTSNSFSNITGGTGGIGGYLGSGGTSGIGSGIYLSSSTNNTLISNIISNINGGTGGMGGYFGSDGADQIGYGVYLEPDSYQNTITSTNTIDNELIVYYYGAISVIIENHILTANINPTNLGKIVLINSNNSIIQNNLVSNFTSETGITGGRGGSGGTGGIGSGIYLSGSINNTLKSNSISNISGGTGGTGGSGGSGGTGGIGSGIYLSGSTNNTLTSNTISNITGGTGGTGGNCYGTGGTGGIGSGIYFSGSTNNTLKSNSISNISGRNGGLGGLGGSGGTGGIGSGIYLSSSTNNTLISNIISNINGGTGGIGEDSGSGGADQIGYGVYLEPDSYQNTITSTNTIDNELIVYYYGAISVIIENHILTDNINPTNLGKIVLINSNNSIIQNNLVSNFTGKTGITGGHYGSGGAGGIGSGIYLSGSINNTLKSNSISNISGGTGGTGGNYYGTGGTGGISSGIYLSGSTNNTLTSNTISNITGGTGGKHYGTGGTGGIGSGIYFSGSTNNTLIFNCINNSSGGTGGIGGSYKGSAGASGIGYGLFFESNSYPNMVDSTNTIDGIQTLPPETILNSYMPDPTNNTTLRYTGDAVDSLSDIMKVEYRIRGSVWTPASPIDGIFDYLTESFEFTTPQLEDGTYTIEVRAINVLGQIDQTYALDTITIDSGIPPTISIAYPTPGSITGTNTTLIASTNEPATVKYDFVDVNYTLMNYTFSSTGITTHTTPLTNLPAGSNTIYVAASDLSGNINTTTLSVTWNVDSSGPQLSQMLINNKTTDSINSNPNITTLITSTFYPIIAVEYFIDTIGPHGTGTALTPSGTYTQDIDFNLDISALSDGDHTIYLHAANQIRWGGYQAAVFTIDTTPPAITFTSPANATTIIDTTPQVSFTITDTGGVNISTLLVNGSSTELGFNVTTDCQVSGTEVICTFTVDTPYPDPSTNNITVDAADNLGNPAQNRTEFYVDSQSSAVYINNGQAPASRNITIPIWINVTDPSGLGAATVNLTIDPQVLSLISVNSSDFDSNTSYIDNDNGTVRIVAYQTSETGVGPGIIRLANVTVRTIGNYSDTSPLDIEVETFKNNTGIGIPYYITDGNFLIVSDGDFSGDGTTDSWDITYLARSITGIPGYESLSSGDVSGDGVVDAWDCTYLARAIAGVPGYSV